MPISVSALHCLSTTDRGSSRDPARADQADQAALSLLQFRSKTPQRVAADEGAISHTGRGASRSSGLYADSRK